MICGHVEVALGRRRRADADRLVGHGDVLEVAVDGGVHRDRRDAERVARAQDAQRDLAAVGDDDFVQHGACPSCLSRSRTAAGRTRSAGRSRPGSRRTVPETSASIGLNIFIASMMPSVSPALTAWPTLTNAGLSGDRRGVEGADHRRAHDVARRAGRPRPWRVPPLAASVGAVHRHRPARARGRRARAWHRRGIGIVPAAACAPGARTPRLP